MNVSGHGGRQLAIFGEMLPWILAAARREPRFPTLLQQRLARDRRFGSRDRRIYRELAYAAVRFLPRLEAAPEPERAVLALRFAGELPELKPLRAALGASSAPATPDAEHPGHTVAPTPPVPDGTPHPETPHAESNETNRPATRPADSATDRATSPGTTPDADTFPEWIGAECPALADAAVRAALNSRSPLWLRAQRATPAALAQFLADEGLPFRASPILPGAFAVLRETDLTRTAEYERGDFEIQDLGSQLILALAAPVPGERWLDACAGAGGKTLQLAQILGPSGLIDATDIRAAALDELAARALRAGLRQIRVVADPAKLAASYDGVLVDAPCSGTGTWRRSPHLKWQTRVPDLARHAARQLAILTAQAARVRPGGRLVYATCSLARRENEDVIAAFLAARPEFRIESPAETLGAAHSEFGLTILPPVHDTDGFFVAPLRRRAPDGGA